MEWSEQQKQALQAIKIWYRNLNTPAFRLFGYAGTGKTTLARYIGDEVAGKNVYYASYTGKAALTMRERGCENATTIHNLIYIARGKSHEQLQKLETHLGNLMAELLQQQATLDNNPDVKRLTEMIKEERRKLAQPNFKLNEQSPLVEADLIVIDECSMVDSRMGQDLLSFNIPILVLGDPAQLPPVGSSGFFTKQRPDFLLDQIHRQAEDNPIIEMATALRNQKPLRFGEYGESRIIKKAEITTDIALGCDQILVGRNKTRHNINSRMRQLEGFTTGVTKGDRVVCLRNNHDLGILNGSLWMVRESFPGMPDRVFLTLDAVDGSNAEVNVEAHLQHFQQRSDEIPIWERREAEEFDYSYALTCHKAQGSQWESILIFDESFCFRQDKFKWLYTAVTRAKERVTIVTD